MRIAVLNGSPKGKYSTTLQLVKYMRKHYKEMDFIIYDISQRIDKIKADEVYFEQILDDISMCDCVLWCYPVYTYFVPYQFMSFINMVFDLKKENAFRCKYAFQISTSKHFYDHTAYNYMQNISEDMGMKHIGGFCGDEDTLQKIEGRRAILTFGEEVKNAIECNLPTARVYCKTECSTHQYIPLENIMPVSKTNKYNIVLVTDYKDSNSNLNKMVETFTRLMPNTVNIVNINEFKFDGGCLGCLNCAIDGKCVYRDGFDTFHKENIFSADCVIFAAEIKRHGFNPVWKCYEDRQFYNGHRTGDMGKVIGYIISGPLRYESNLREVLEARSEVNRQFLTSIVTDEYASSEEITRLLEGMADKVMWALEKKPQRPASYLGIGGAKIFRDMVYLMQGIMKEDHKFYKENGLYDFPQREFKRILLMKIVGILMRLKGKGKMPANYVNEKKLGRFEKLIERF